jgi:hypothetical protein
MTMRAVRGDLKQTPVDLAAGSVATPNIGDILYYDSSTDKALPASSYPVSGLTTEALLQEAIHDVFLGVSLSKQLASSAARKGLVATTGVHRFACDSATFEPGDLVGVIGTLGSGTYSVAAADMQKVKKVSYANLAIGRVVEYKASATEILVEIVSTKLYGGVQSVG